MSLSERSRGFTSATGATALRLRRVSGSKLTPILKVAVRCSAWKCGTPVARDSAWRVGSSPISGGTATVNHRL
jgi:hypothetical protein